MISYGKQDISKEDVAAVCEVLESDFLTQGPMVPKFEELVRTYCGVRHAVAVNSATSALHIALLALGVQQDDLVWTSPNSFVASANCAIYCNASVDFVDVEDGGSNMCVRALKEKLVLAHRQGKLPKVVIPVHFSGVPCKMPEISKLARQYGFKVLEDASHAIGAEYPDGKVGNCKYSDITVFSFHPVKIITTAEGGMAVTNNQDLYDNMCLLRSHGITREASKLTNTSPASWYYEQQELGFNYRMSDIHAALGVSQIRRLDDFISARAKIANIYDQNLANLPLRRPVVSEGYTSSFHLYVIRLKLTEHGNLNHAKIFEELRNNEIGVNVHYIPIHTQPYYRKLGFNWGDFPNAERHASEAISIPIYPTMTDDEITLVIDVLQRVVKN